MQRSFSGKEFRFMDRLNMDKVKYFGHPKRWKEDKLWENYAKLISSQHGFTVNFFYCFLEGLYYLGK